MAKIRVTQMRNGKRVTFLTPDKGKPGKTPKDKQWYEPGVKTGWEKDMPQGERRGLVLRAHKGDELASARAMQSLANVTTDRETKREARVDAVFFFGEYKSHPHGIMGRSRQLNSPEVTKLTGDIFDRMTPVERDNLRVKALAASSFSDPNSLNVSKYWDEYWGEEKRALIREYKKEQGRTDNIACRNISRRTPRITPKTPRLRR